MEKSNLVGNVEDSVQQKSTYFISHAGRDRVQSLYEPFAPLDFLREWQQKTMREKPKSILIVSPHWETVVPTVTVASGLNSTFYDVGHLHESYYKLKYPAPGAPEVAKRVKELLIGSGFDRVEEDAIRGLDHGAWIILLLMYPQADIPVCQLSVQSHENATYHYNLGKALAPLKEEGVLIIGSGNATHNVALANKAKQDDPVAPCAMEFDTWLMEALHQGRYGDVNEYLEKAPQAKMAHPTPEHIYPLHVAMGAAGDESKGQLINHAWDCAYKSFASYRFTSTSSPTCFNYDSI